MVNTTLSDEIGVSEPFVFETLTADGLSVLSVLPVNVSLSVVVHVIIELTVSDLLLLCMMSYDGDTGTEFDTERVFVEVRCILRLGESLAFLHTTPR